MSRDLNMATPVIREFTTELIVKAKSELKLVVFVTNIDRTFQVQLAYYAQGRQPLSEVNLLRRVAGLDLLPELDSKGKIIIYKKITWTMCSKHIINLFDTDPTNDKSKAVDVGISFNGKYMTDDKDMDADGIPEYQELGILGERIGNGKIRWGGRFKDSKGKPCPDYPHYEEI